MTTIPRVDIFYFDKYKRKINFNISLKDFEHYKIQLLEKSLVENIGDVWYTMDNITKKLDYYND